MQPTSHVILFLAANPRDTAPLALDLEARAIHEELRGLRRIEAGERFTGAGRRR